MNQVDLNVQKDFSILEGLRAQIRADFINAFNEVHLQGPNTDITSASFGRVTSQGNQARVIQFQFRLIF
jgi:hypothetical protein